MEVKIEDISYQGNGVGRCNGKVVFVPHVDVGEVVDVDVVDNKSSYCTAKVNTILEKSACRQTPPCKYFGLCRGCDFQHLNYEREIQLKKKILCDQFKKVGYKSDIEVVRSEKRFGYRNKIRLTFKKGSLGYNAEGKLVDIDECLLADEKIKAAVRDVRAFLKERRLKNLQSVTFRSGDESVMIAFLFDKTEEVDFSPLYKYKICAAIGDVLESEGTEVWQINRTEVFKTVGDFNLSVGAKSFFQVNDEIAQRLYEFVVNKVRGGTIVNAYSGQGVLTNILAQKCERVIGVECEEESHKLAQKIRLGNVTNLCAKVEDVLEELTTDEKVDAIVLDPAREGCDKKVLDAIKSAKIEKIVYISCNFATLIRDLKLLQEDYAIDDVRAFDMFPNTANIETVAELTYKGEE